VGIRDIGGRGKVFRIRLGGCRSLSKITYVGEVGTVMVLFTRWRVLSGIEPAKQCTVYLDRCKPSVRIKTSIPGSLGSNKPV